MKEKNRQHSCKSCGDTVHETSDRSEEGNEIETVFRISGADCADEVNSIRKSLAEIGIHSVSVNLVAATATVSHSPEVSSLQLKSAIESTGVKVIEQGEISFFVANRARILLVIGSGILLFLGLILQWTSEKFKTEFLLIYTASTIMGGVLVFPKAYRALKRSMLDINILMSVAVIGAFAIREYSEGATVVFLFSLAELLESLSISKARSAIRAVLNLAPPTAIQKKGSDLRTVPVEQIRIDDLVIVRAGDNIPLDGTIMEGTSTVNQAPLTGESIPVEKKVGDSVFAGTLNENGLLTVKVTKIYSDSKISRIQKLIEQAQQQKSPSETFVDRFAKVYTPIVFIIAIGVAFVPPLFLSETTEVWYYRALVLLVIACPCALVLATPISVVSGLASLARKGVLVKGGKHLEALGKIKALALDKTGTLTEGRFKVLSFSSFNGADSKAVLQVALALEKSSSHPLAKAIVEYCKTKVSVVAEAKGLNVIPGRGAEGQIESCLYFVGNHKLAHDLGLCSDEIERYLLDLERQALSVVIVGHKPHASHQGKILGIFGLGDVVRDKAKQAVNELYRLGIEKIVVLSGDNQKTVDAICGSVGIQQGKGNLLPEDKVNEIKKLSTEFNYVAMIGDGVNDAPAIAQSTVGISMGAGGTDSAIETSDITLMQDDISQLPVAIAQGRRVVRVIQFNVAFAILIKLVFFVLAMLGFSNLWLAVAADMGASLVVSLNALRLLKIQKAEIR